MKPLKIGNASGFWGDDVNAPARLVKQQGDLDFLTLDYLAEVSLSIMAVQKEKDPKAGYAQDFVSAIRSLIPLWKSGARFKVITNAGGLNPRDCAKACAEELRKADLNLKIAVISGDDVLEKLLKEPEKDLYNNLDTGKKLSDITSQLYTANAYLGAKPIAEALHGKADIVIGCRIADPSLTVGPCLYHFSWSETDYDKIAGATVAGHLIECGTQVTGGISCDWLNLPNPSTVGFPIAEVDSEGRVVITKPKGTGGAVTEKTVKEQLLYELGDPAEYLSPDAKVSFLSLKVQNIGQDRVLVENAKGSAPTALYKVSATYRAGYKAEAYLVVFGKDAEKKARKAGETIFDKLKLLRLEPQRSKTECLGAGDLVPGVLKTPDLKECVLRVAAADPRRDVLEQFAKEIAPLVTSGPPGITGYSSGRPKVRPVFGFWPCLIEKNEVSAQVDYL